MSNDDHLTSVELKIPASPEQIFDLLADPSRHHEIDGSGSVRHAKTGAQRLALGSTFTMSMKIGIPYSTLSTIVEYEEHRRIAWQTYSTIKWLAKFGGGRIWRYELEPVAGGTLVRESWDTSQEGPPDKPYVVKARTRQYMITNMQKTLVRLQEVTSAEAATEEAP